MPAQASEAVVSLSSAVWIAVSASLVSVSASTGVMPSTIASAEASPAAAINSS